MSGSSTSMKWRRVAGSISMTRASAPLRTTCLCTWDSGGTSMTTSPRSCVWQESLTAGGQTALCHSAASTLEKAERCASARSDAVLGEFAFADIDLAAPADGPAAAHRIDIDAQRTRRLSTGVPSGNASSLARGRKNDQRVGVCPITASRRRPRSRARRCFDVLVRVIPPVAVPPGRGRRAYRGSCWSSPCSCLSVPLSTLAP